MLILHKTVADDVNLHRRQVADDVNLTEDSCRRC